jgi:hypothetical protein
LNKAISNVDKSKQNKEARWALSTIFNKHTNDKKEKSARFLMALVTRNFFLSCLFKIDQISSMERERERIRN